MRFFLILVTFLLIPNQVLGQPIDLSIDSDVTAMGRGFKLPLVISTSINANALKGNKINKINKYLNIMINLLTSLLHQNSIANLSISHILC